MSIAKIVDYFPLIIQVENGEKDERSKSVRKGNWDG